MALASHLLEADPLRGDLPVSSIIILNDALGHCLAQRSLTFPPAAF